MSPETAMEKPIEIYRGMSGEERLLMVLRLHELSCEVTRDGIRARLPNATTEPVEEELRERLKLAYEL